MPYIFRLTGAENRVPGRAAGAAMYRNTEGAGCGFVEIRITYLI